MVVMTMVVMVMAVLVMVGVATLEKPGTGKIDQQTNPGNRDGLVVVDRCRCNQTLNRLVEHQPSHTDEKDRTAITAQHLDLPSTKGESSVASEAAGS